MYPYVFSSSSYGAATKTQAYVALKLNIDQVAWG